MTILDQRETYKPFQYPWAAEYHHLQSQQQHWNPDEVSFSDDIQHFKKLTEAEQKFLRDIFTFFVASDNDIGANYVSKYLPTFPAPEIRMMLLAFANMESTHAAAYAKLMEAMGFEDYDTFLGYPEMVEKHEHLDVYCPASGGVGSMLVDIAIGSAFGEGLQLFGSFTMLLSFADRGLLPGVRDVVSWSLRDESVHVRGLIRIFHELRTDFPESWNDDTKRRIYDEARTMVELEDRFISLVYTDHLNLPNLPKADLHRYIRYLADYRLGQLGLKPVYYVESNPISWLSKFSNEVHDDLFTNTGVSYQHTNFNEEEMWQNV